MSSSRAPPAAHPPHSCAQPCARSNTGTCMHSDKAPCIHTLQLQCPRVHMRTGTSTLPAAPLGAPSTQRGSRNAGRGMRAAPPPTHTHTHWRPCRLARRNPSGQHFAVQTSAGGLSRRWGPAQSPGGIYPLARTMGGNRGVPPPHCTDGGRPKITRLREGMPRRCHCWPWLLWHRGCSGGN